MNNRVSGQDWFYHAPRKEEKSVKFADVLPASQIPGLGNHENGPVDLSEDIHLRRKWIRDTDSKYVKLAKAGGRKDLFIYREHKPSSDGGVGYPRVDWFDHDTPRDEQEEQGKSTSYKSAYPEWYVHDEYKRYQQEDFHPSKEKRSLLGFDDMSIWKREAEEDSRRVKSSPEKLPSLTKNTKYPSKTRIKIKKESEQNFKLPEIPTINQIKSKQGSNIGQLLSMKYQNDWIDEQGEKKKNVERRKKKSMEKEDFSERESKVRTKQNATQTTDDKPLFKLSRFANVGPKTNTHRT